jgi:transmembrane sensor
MPDRESAEREASAWIARLNADDVSTEERARFASWRNAHPRNARAYDELSATWQRLAQAGPLVRAVSFGQAINAAASSPAPRRSWTLVAAAAAVALVGFLVTQRLLQLKNETQFQTAVGEHADVSLPDGSSLDLNSNSVARVEYSGRTRVIRLERGEAFFKVAHDPQRPFWVVAGDSWVRAVGTEFNVYRRSTDVEVTVNEGTVKVVAQRGDHETPTDQALGTAAVSILTAGEQIDVRGHSAVVRVLEPLQLQRSVSWRAGTLYFESRPLGEVIDEMSRYSTLKIEVIDPSLRRLPIGGTFRASPAGVDALLTMLQEGLGLTVKRQGEERALVEAPAEP